MPFKNQSIYCFLFLTVLVVPVKLIAQYSPYFQNYTLSEYNAGNKNWDVSKAENGKLYVANDYGLLEFDGLKWTFKELPNKTTIRSVLAYKDRIYTGSYEEFGYWKTDAKGELVYTSLSESIQSQISDAEEFWEIIAFQDAIIFKSFINVYVYRNNKITIINPPSTVSSIDIADNKLFVSTLNRGIFTLKNDSLVPAINNNALRNAYVVTISNINKDIFITTQLEGCFMYSNHKLTPWKSPINELVKEHQLNRFSRLENGDMVFGTIKNGVYLTNSLGEIIYHINKENGLANNTILGQFVDSNHKLWLGLDNGIASVDLNSHLTFYNDLSGRLGTVYDVIK